MRIKRYAWMSYDDHLLLVTLAQSDPDGARKMERLLYNQARSDRLFAEHVTLSPLGELETTRGIRDAQATHGCGGGHARRIEPEAT